ncbi:MAG: hypothetical protein AAF514_16330 [Verrucomicrobiota bacterium]
MKNVATFHVLTAGAGLLSCVLFLPGCKPPEIAVYQIPKEDYAAKPKPPSPPMGDAPAAQPPAASSAAAASGHAVEEAVDYDVPEGWVTAGGDSETQASFTLGGLREGQEINIAIRKFPDGFGSQLQFANIVASVLNLPPLTEADLEKIGRRETLGEKPFYRFDLSGKRKVADGEKDTAVQIALHNTSRHVWFSRMIGDPDLVAGEGERYNAFLTSLRFSEKKLAAKPATMNGRTLPASAVGKEDLPEWTLPEGWTALEARPPRRASFGLAGGPEIDFSVTSFPGDVGGMKANVERWARQIGLPPISESDLASVNTAVSLPAGEGTVTDLTHDDQRVRVLTLMHNEQSWFFKMQGPKEQIDGQVANFDAFIQTLKF